MFPTLISIQVQTVVCPHNVDGLKKGLAVVKGVHRWYDGVYEWRELKEGGEFRVVLVRNVYIYELL